MTSKKRAFIRAGSILAIVWSALIAMTGLICFASTTLLTRDFVVPILFEVESGYDEIENADGSFTYKFQDPETLEVITIHSEDVDQIIELAKSTIVSIGVFCVSLAVASFVIAILMLVAAGGEKKKYKGLTIAQLVLSLFSANVVTFAFMIVTLCLKDNPTQA